MNILSQDPSSQGSQDTNFELKIQSEPKRCYEVEALRINCFELLDIDFGFIPENRVLRFSALISAKNTNKKLSNKLYTLFPMRFFDETQEYFAAYNIHIDELTKIAGSDWVPNALLRVPDESILDEVPKNLLSYLDPCSMIQDDADAENFEYTDYNKYVNNDARTEYFRSEPYLFGQEVATLSTGCAHYLRGCTIFCPKCKQEHCCEKCHNEANRSCFQQYKELKSSDVEQIRCMSCSNTFCVSDLHGTTSDILHPVHCPKCDYKLSEVFCPECKIFTLQTPNFRPMFHCQRHKTCHTRMSEQFHSYCENCDVCVSPIDKRTHICFKNKTCILCFGEIESAESCYSVCQHPNHVIHSECESMLPDRYHCPICRLAIPGFVHHRNNLLFVFDWIIKLTKLEEFNLFVCLCQDCKQTFVDISVALCPRCFVTGKQRQVQIAEMSKDQFIYALMIFKFGADDSEVAQSVRAQMIENRSAEFVERIARHDVLLQFIGVF